MEINAEEITKLFVKAGLHVDAVNLDGSTAAECSSYSKLKNFKIFKNLNNIVFCIENLQLIIKQHEICTTTLKCLASRVIAQHKIWYRSIVPSHLEKFIQLHSRDKL